MSNANVSNANNSNTNVTKDNVTNDSPFVFNANSDHMDSDFTKVKSKRKIPSNNADNFSEKNEPGLKIAKHAATSRSFQLPTNNRFSNLNEINLPGNNSNRNSNLPNINS